MSSSNEIPDRDFERQSTNHTRAGPFFSGISEALDVATSVFPPAQVIFAGIGILLQSTKNTLRNPSSHAAFRKDEYAIRMSKGVTGSVLVFAALFSGVVATFLALSIPDLRNQNGSHTASLVVNILWLLSLVLSLGSAYFASKVQEWVETYPMTKTHQTTGTQTTEIHQLTETHQITEIHQITETRQATGSVRETFPFGFRKLLEYWTAFLDYISALLIVIILEIMRTSLEIAVLSFFAGLVVYVWNIHAIAGHYVLGFVCFFIFCDYTVTTTIDKRTRNRN